MEAAWIRIRMEDADPDLGGKKVQRHTVPTILKQKDVFMTYLKFSMGNIFEFDFSNELNLYKEEFFFKIS